MKKLFGGLAAFALIASLFIGGTNTQAADPTWDLTGNYVLQMEFEGTNYAHDASITQDAEGNLDGTGGHPAGGTHVYAWDIVSGSVDANTFTFTANYTLGAVGTTMTVTGTVGNGGTLDGTWTDNHNGTTRNGTFMSSAGTATEIDDTEEPLTFTIDPGVYDPDGLGDVVSEWDTVGGSNPDRNPTYPTNKDDCKNGGWKNTAYQPPFKNQGQCVSYAVNEPANEGGNDVLLLQKNADTSSNQAAVVDFTGEEGIVLTSLGFDYKTDSYCGAGAPRFNVYTEEGTYYFFGCTYGTHTDLGNGWTRVTFDDLDAVMVGTQEWPGFGTVEISDVQIVMDEEGQAVLDNIMINGTSVGDM